MFHFCKSGKILVKFYSKKPENLSKIPGNYTNKEVSKGEKKDEKAPFRRITLNNVEIPNEATVEGESTISKSKREKGPTYLKTRGIEIPFIPQEERGNVSLSGKVYLEKLTPKMEEIMKRLGVEVSPTTFLSAFTHPSYGYSKIKNNQRLAFIGGSFLRFCVGEDLASRYKDESYSNLELFTSLYLTPTFLGNAARVYEINENILVLDLEHMSTKKKREIAKDCVLAIIGAVYEHNGVEKAHSFVHEKIICGMSPNLVFSLFKTSEKALPYSTLEIITAMTGSPPVEHIEKISSTEFRCSLFNVNDKELLSVGNGTNEENAKNLALLNLFSSLRQRIPEK